MSDRFYCLLCEVVDGEDLTRFDVADDESTEQNLRDEDTLAQLDREFTQHNPGKSFKSLSDLAAFLACL